MSTEDLRNQKIADYVLGLMDEAQERGFDAEMDRDGDLARTVSDLQARFHALDETAQPEEVPDALWAAIAARLDSVPDAPANDQPSRTIMPSGLMRVARPVAMAASLAIAVGIGFAGGVMMQPTPTTPVVIAVLATDDMRPGAIIEAFGDDSIRIVPLEALSAPEGQVLEVWTLPDEETGPVSLGTFSQAQELILRGPDLPPPQPDQLYEITIEPEGGSPTGLPTGPILLIGNAQVPVI